jgi:hypothetical protein
MNKLSLSNCVHLPQVALIQSKGMARIHPHDTTIQPTTSMIPLLLLSIAFVVVIVVIVVVGEYWHGMGLCEPLDAGWLIRPPFFGTCPVVRALVWCTHLVFQMETLYGGPGKLSSGGPDEVGV